MPHKATRVASPFMTIGGDRAADLVLVDGKIRTPAHPSGFVQAAADRIGLNATDLNCLNILSFSGQLTAGELAKATGLTTASITGVIDRLEDAGFVERERDAADRRRVVIHLNLAKAFETVAPVFAPMLADWQRVAAQYNDDELRLIVEFYGRMEQIIREHLARLRAAG